MHAGRAAGLLRPRRREEEGTGKAAGLDASRFQSKQFPSLGGGGFARDAGGWRRDWKWVRSTSTRVIVAVRTASK
jgi:hypothetical protein